MDVSVKLVANADPLSGGQALLIAQTLIEGFNKHYRLFRASSASAKSRFEQGDWQGVQTAVKERIQFYDDRVAETVERLHRDFNAETIDDVVWQQAKLYYIGLLTNHSQPELAETFFNSVFCKILHRTYFHNDFIFVRPAISTEYIESDPPSYRCYYPDGKQLPRIDQANLSRFQLAVRIRRPRSGCDIHLPHGAGSLG